MIRKTGQLLAIFFIGFALNNSLLAQDYEVKVRVSGLSNDTIYLANYYGAKLFYNDTTVTNANGEFSFPGKSYDECGKYAIVMPKQVYFDFLMVDEPMEFETAYNNPFGRMKVIKSQENKVFFGHMNFIQHKRAERAPFDAVLKDSTATKEQVAEAKEGLKLLSNTVLERQNEIIDGGYLFGKYLKMMKEIEIPSAPDHLDKAEAEMWEYQWYRKHYWDNVDLNDPRIVRDGTLHKILEKYWNRVLPPDVDTIYTEATKLISKVEHNYQVYKYFLHYMTFESESSKVMCMDKVFVNLIHKYYSGGRVDWLSDEQMKKMTDRADELMYTLCGEKVPDINLPGIDQTTWKSLHSIDSKYTLLTFWESTCGHCKKELPVLQRVYEEWNDKGFEIYAVGNDFETEPWIEYLEESNYQDWIHVSDNPRINAQDSAMALIYGGVTDLLSLNFRTTFDIYATPKLFLLDENKSIIAKQISAGQLAEILHRLEGVEYPGDDFYGIKQEKAKHE